MNLLRTYSNKIYLSVEALGERFVAMIGHFEPKWLRNHPQRLWVPIVAMLCFVFVDNFRPADPRTIMTLTPFEIDAQPSWLSLFFSVTKIEHISYFFLLYLFLWRLWGSQNETRIRNCILALTLLIEFQQGFTAGRDARPLDILPNLMGMYAGRWYMRDRLRRGK